MPWDTGVCLCECVHTGTGTCVYAYLPHNRKASSDSDRPGLLCNSLWFCSPEEPRLVQRDTDASAVRWLLT